MWTGAMSLIVVVLCGAGTLTAAASLLDLGSAAGQATWTVSNSNGSVALPAAVPGGVYSDLVRGGVLRDLLVGFNDVVSRWVAHDQWTYNASFYVTVEQLSARAALLVLHGVDTVAFVHLNGHPLGRTDNMFVRYTYPVKELLQVGVNVLTIEFESPVAAAQARSDRYFVAPQCVPDYFHGECHANQIRKMQASFGWDWGPAFPSVGLWKPAHIEFIDSAVIRTVTTRVRRLPAGWEVTATAHLETGLTGPTAIMGSLEARLQTNSKANITAAEQVAVTSDADGAAKVDLTLGLSEEEVSVWWPNGFGEQPLYALRVSWYGGARGGGRAGSHASHRDLQLGFRTLELVEEDASLHLGNSSGAEGLTFHFKVNGYPLFMKGSNWIPGHVLPELGSDETMIDEALSAAREAHMAMLRVWGGGVYESDHFYSRCDQLGILVWQDFMFACSMYPADAEFLRSVAAEVEQNVMRLQHHASVALWAGNNENEVALRGDWYATQPQFERYKSEYVKLYVDTIRPLVEAADPTRRYLVSSPSNGRESEREGYVAQDPYSAHYGDTHYYNYIADGWSANIYPRTRFASEYGFQSFPSLATMRTATNNSEDFQLTSEYSVHRQHSAGGNLAIKTLIDKHLLLEESDPDYFAKFVFYSQISQAMTMKAETEFYRQSQADWYTMGALYWQLNDIWQAPSWASIEYGGRWKMLHYFAKNFFAPVLVSPRLLASGDIEVYLINDQLVPIPHAEVIVDTFSYASLTALDTKSYNTSIGALKAEKQPIFINALDIKHNTSIFFRFSLKSGKITSPFNYVFPQPLKTATGLRVPNIQIEVKKAHSYELAEGKERRFTVRVTCDAVVLFLWLDAPGVRGRFVDNGVHVTEPLTRLQYVADASVQAERLRDAITYRYYIHPAH